MSNGNVTGTSSNKNTPGVLGENTVDGVGVFGQSQGGEGIHGETNSNQHAAISGTNHSSGPAVWASSNSGIGVFAQNTDPGAADAIQSVTNSNQHAAISGTNHSSGPGIWATSESGPAGYFQGDVQVTGDIKLLGADCAEDFDIAGMEEIMPGTVMVLNQEGALQPSQQAYDKKVAGVISGAGDYKPGIVLDQQQSNANRLPIALIGKVYCKVDAKYSPIEIGDLLTTSPTSGHAMKAADPLKAFGAVLGKALRSQQEGQGLIPILVALQ